mmetsp:Transcript_17252/g.56066  ORF Transcript_17252/g.56066 Transcript_17252/m.56066 type:complete len:251 (+) Transcript_17252:532-1284(+)
MTLDFRTRPAISSCVSLRAAGGAKRLLWEPRPPPEDMGFSGGGWSWTLLIWATFVRRWLVTALTSSGLRNSSSKFASRRRSLVKSKSERPATRTWLSTSTKTSVSSMMSSPMIASTISSKVTMPTTLLKSGGGASDSPSSFDGVGCSAGGSVRPPGAAAAAARGVVIWGAFSSNDTSAKDVFRCFRGSWRSSSSFSSSSDANWAAGAAGASSRTAAWSLREAASGGPFFGGGGVARRCSRRCSDCSDDDD